MFGCKSIKSRPTALELEEILREWKYEKSTELKKQIWEADEINKNMPINKPLISLSYETHSEADTSRLLNFNNPPGNSNEFYNYFTNDSIELYRSGLLKIL